MSGEQAASDLNEDSPDFDIRSEFRVDAGFIIGYALLFAGLLLFGWDPRYVFLGLAIELLIALVGFQAQSYIAASFATFLLAILLSSPAILATVSFAAYPLSEIASDDGSDTWAMLGLLAFFASSIYSSVQRFRATSLRTARFYRHLNEKYMFENGSPVLGGISLIMGSVSTSWLSAVVFFFSFFVSCVAGPLGRAAAVIMVTLCLLRHLFTIAIVNQAFNNQKVQEDVWLEALGKTGKVVLRDE